MILWLMVYKFDYYFVMNAQGGLTSQPGQRFGSAKLREPIAFCLAHLG
jgi:hypothetical protein